ncbi:hypothetical protein Fmac_001082 [Flemingia macrophylla]|uniref:Uncharacterized protein n=1 Tax=Flemingia macrophylla TaxID=520843 RepID=A0ABD1NG29_9FABA
MAALFRTAMHQAADVGSGTRTGTESISPTNMRKSSGGSNVDLEPSQTGRGNKKGFLELHDKHTDKLAPATHVREIEVKTRRLWKPSHL